MNYFGKRLKCLRREDNLTQNELATALGIAKSTVSMYESGKREPDFEMIEAVADFFNVPMSTFFLTSNEEKETAAQAGSGLSPLDAQLMDLLHLLTDDQKQMLIAQIKMLLTH